MKKILATILMITIVFTLTSCLNPFNVQISPPPTATPLATLIPTEVQTPLETPIPTVAIPDTPTPSPTDVPPPVPVPEPVLQVLASDTNVYAFGGGSNTITFDLNQDGTDDIITFEFYSMSGTVPAGVVDLSSPYMTMMDLDIYQCNLQINGQPIIIQGEMMAGIVIIGDIDASDSQYEVMVPWFGPSGDPETAFIAYQGIAPINIGTLYDNPLLNLKVDGTNEITGSKRGMTLHTWFYDAIYNLQGGLIEESKLDGKYVRMDHPVTALVNLPLQVSPTDASAAYTLNAGDNAVITLTDDERWFLVKNTSGQKGWFEITGFYTINGQPATAVFDGLSMAD